MRVGGAASGVATPANQPESMRADSRLINQDIQPWSANEQPGMVFIKTIVSLDRLEEAQRLLRDMIDTVADSIEEYELQEAKRAILNALVGNFETNFGIAKSLIFLEKYNLSADYFDMRASLIEPITVSEVQQAVKKVLRNDRLITLRIGRV